MISDCLLLDIPYGGSDDDDDEAVVDSLQFVDAGTVNVASTSRTVRYWETRQMATHINVAASSVRTTAVTSLLLAITSRVVGCVMMA